MGLIAFKSEKFSITMQAGGSLFIITTYTFNDRKVAVGVSILAICHGNKVVLVVGQ